MGSLASKESRSGELKPFASLREDMVERNIVARGVLSAASLKPVEAERWAAR